MDWGSSSCGRGRGRSPLGVLFLHLCRVSPSLVPVLVRCPSSRFSSCRKNNRNSSSPHEESRGGGRSGTHQRSNFTHVLPMSCPARVFQCILQVRGSEGKTITKMGGPFVGRITTNTSSSFSSFRAGSSLPHSTKSHACRAAPQKKKGKGNTTATVRPSPR